MWNWRKIFGDKIKDEPEITIVCDVFDLDEAIKAAILKALSATNWQQNKAAKLLRISPRELNYKISNYGITHPNWKINI